MPRPSRRDVLRVGTAALGLTLPALLRADSTRPKASADHCLLAFLSGGPSHHDMWDLKPDAPAEIRGEFNPIKTNVTGSESCELMPLPATPPDARGL